MNANFTVYKFLQFLSNLPRVVHRLAAVKILIDFDKKKEVYI